jgi:hypothetical protein
MKIANIAAIIFASSTLVAHTAAKSQIIVGSVYVNDAKKLKKARYAELNGIIATMPPNLPKVYGLEKRNISILFVSPDTETMRREFVFVKGLFKPSKENQDLIAIDTKIVQEFVWLSLEISGYVGKVDAVEAEFFEKSIQKDYDYIVTVSTDFSGKRDYEAATERLYIYTLKNTKNNKEVVISKTNRLYSNAGGIASALFKAADSLEN